MSNQNGLTHLDPEGRPRMVDVSRKAPTRRRAVAAGCLVLGEAEAKALEAGALPKGDPWNLARIGAVNGVKRTADLIPLAHPLRVDGINVEHCWDRDAATAWMKVEVVTEGRTGVEMEAMAGVCGGLLVLYDMLKAAGQNMALGPVRLLLKEGGRRGTVTGSLPGCPWQPQA
ncbi:MAG: cyclic pyranopterin monophosphate synthase MoaC [Acidobacteriota bacterium]|nr:cyclic pyranopterin monophosphate synthase MoaC [Acidobacteriota bacterium]